MRIFVSYSRADHHLAERLKTDLTFTYGDVWFDERLKQGTNWWNEIEKQIRMCDAFVYLYTPPSDYSEWAEQELRHATEYLKPIVVVNMTLGTPPAHLACFPNFALADYYEREITKLYEQLDWIRDTFFQSLRQNILDDLFEFDAPSPIEQDRYRVATQRFAIFLDEWLQARKITRTVFARRLGIDLALADTILDGMLPQSEIDDVFLSEIAQAAEISIRELQLILERVPQVHALPIVDTIKQNRAEKTIPLAATGISNGISTATHVPTPTPTAPFRHDTITPKPTLSVQGLAMPAKQRIDVFISSTSIDLPEHRAAVRDAILSLGLFPSGMEHWPVRGENPVELCHNMVNDAEIYLGIYAHRYGWQPDGFDGKSITELEYEWAGEVRREGKPIPRLCFIMDDGHPWPKDRMELDAQDKLVRFKTRVKESQIGFFTSPDNLKAQVTAALASFAQRNRLEPAIPYLRWLHEQSKKSGLLHVLTPRDATSDAKPITVEQVYTPLDTGQMVTRDEAGKVLPTHASMDIRRLGPEDERREQSPLSAMEAASLSQHLVLLGDPGSGKSTFINFLALCLTGYQLDPDSDWLERLREQGWEQEALLPVVITLRDFAQDMSQEVSGNAALLFEHIERQLNRWKLEDAAPTIHNALNNGQALVLLDGLDEVPGERRDLVRDTITDFVERYHPHNRYILTCRILSYTNPAWKLPKMVEKTISPFNQDKINHFIDAWYTAMTALGATDTETAQHRIADLSAGIHHPHLQGIASNPMLLTVMAIVHNHTGALPRESARLYQECVNLLMWKWRPTEARSLIETLNVREDDLYRLLWEIAYDAHDKQGEREAAADISESDVIAIAASYLNHDMGKAQIFCDYIEQRAGLLIGRGTPDRWRVFSFPHRTFQEYLAGCYAANNSFWELAAELADRGSSWREVLMLAAGHLVFNQGRVDIPLLAIDELTPAEEPPQNEVGWQRVWLAGDMLALIGAQSIQTTKRGPRILSRLQERLAELVSGGYLTPVERAAAGRTLAVLGDPRPGVGVQDGIPDIVWCDIPAGEYLYQRNQRVTLPAYRIAKYPITFIQFQAFLDADEGFRNDAWWVGMSEEAEAYSLTYKVREMAQQRFVYANHPRETVSWYQAVAFCRWLSTKVGYEVRLPTEQEWEAAACYPDGREYPWGDEFSAEKCNVRESEIGQTTAVGMYPDGANPANGIHDLSGNVLEWCLNKYQDPEMIEVDESNAPRVLRGGSWYDLLGGARASFRSGYLPTSRYDPFGFRVVSRPSSP